MYDFNFELTKEDFLNFGKDIYSIPRIRNTNLFPTILLIVIFDIVSALIFKDLFFIILLTLITVFVVYALLNNGNAMYNANKSSSLVRKMHFNNEGFSINTETTSANFDWKSVIELYNTRHTIFLFQNKQVAIMIPKRVLNNEAEANEFFKFLSDCVNKKYE